MLVPAIPLAALRLRYPHLIENSLHVPPDGANSYLRRYQVAGDRQVHTYSVWFKQGLSPSGSTQGLLYSYYNVDVWNIIGIAKPEYPTHHLYYQLYHRGAYNFILQSDPAYSFADTSGFYHIVFRVDTTKAAPLDRVRFYVNGVQYATTNHPDQVGFDQNWNTYLNYPGWKMYIGGQAYSSQGRTSGTFAMPRYIDGQSLGPEHFGEFMPYKGQQIWVPKEYVGGYGPNGFALDFKNAADLGKSNI